MTITKTFQSPDLPLREILDDIRAGKVQLPDFQRDWVWDDDHVVSLLASVSLSYPIGAVMLLETGADTTVFKPRLVESVELSDPPRPELLILDGQQRLTSLYGALRSGKPVKTKDRKKQVVERWYYIDMEKALDPNGDRDEAVFSIGPDRMRRSIKHGIELDLSAPEREYEQLLFPLAQVLDSSEWRLGFNEYWGYDRDKARLFDQFEAQVIKRFEQYEIPGIELVKETPKDAVCQVFEKVNTGGVVLNVFELLTATYAAENFNLRDDWAERRKTLLQHPVLREVQSTDFLQTIALLKTSSSPDSAVSCKRRDILNLTRQDYETWADPALRGYVDAARVLMAENVFDARDVPYRTQLVPLAAILARLGDGWKSDAVRQKLTRWYWCGVFGEMYGGTTESRFARDVPEVLGWIEGGEEPDTVRTANFSPDRLLTLRTRLSAAYKGLYAILMRDGAQDFVSGERNDIHRYFNDRVDIHHIFPKAWCTKNGIERDRHDSIVNKTPLSAETNRAIGGRAPSVYLETVRRKGGADDERIDEILRTHVIDPIALRADDFETFFEARRRELLERIATAMGMSLIAEEQEGTPAAEEEELAEIDDVLELAEAVE